MTLEVCAESVGGALIAQTAGAHRIELCSAISEGGVTPSHAAIAMARSQLQCKLHVLIRPRGGDFLYDDSEFAIMQADIHHCGEMRCDGVVVGMLRSDGSVDTERSHQLVEVAQKYGMSVTFHRAIDRSNDLVQAMEDAIAMGCSRILTSGGCQSAEQGIPVIRMLVERARGRIIIMPGAGVTPHNAAHILRSTGASEIHGTLSSRAYSRMTYRNAQMGNEEQEYSMLCTDPDKVAALTSERNCGSMPHDDN